MRGAAADRRRRPDVGRLPREGARRARDRARRAPRRDRAGRPRDADLHVGHDRPAQGRDAVARQPRVDLAAAARPRRAAARGDVSLSYLPLSHIAEQMCTVHMPATAGSTVYFAESIDKVPDNLKEARPTVFFGVPRIWEKFHAGARRASSARPPARRSALLDWARRVCARGQRAPRSRRSRSRALLDAQYTLAERLVHRQAQGRDRLRPRARSVSRAPRRSRPTCSSSSRASICRSARSTASPRTPARRRATSPAGRGSATVGPPLPGVEVKIADDGEILVRGPNVFLGYFKEPEATAETLQRRLAVLRRSRRVRHATAS